MGGMGPGVREVTFPCDREESPTAVEAKEDDLQENEAKMAEEARRLHVLTDGRCLSPAGALVLADLQEGEERKHTADCDPWSSPLCPTPENWEWLPGPSPCSHLDGSFSRAEQGETDELQRGGSAL